MHTNHGVLWVMCISVPPLRALRTDRWLSTLPGREPTDRWRSVLDGMTGDRGLSAREGGLLEGPFAPSHGSRVTRTIWGVQSTPDGLGPGSPRHDSPAHEGIPFVAAASAHHLSQHGSLTSKVTNQHWSR